MRIAIISDIHSNIVGLNSVLEAIGKVDAIYCAGDITGYYPFPNEVIEIITSAKIFSVMGNHDKYLIQGFAPENANEKVKQSVFDTKKIISRKSIEFIKGLPEKLELIIDSKKVLICHGSPWDVLEERIYPDFSDYEKFRFLEYDIIIMGHTHYPMLKTVGSKKIVNPGSCGQPRDYNLLSFVLWDTNTDEFVIKRISWDMELFKKWAMERGADSALFDVFSRVKL